MLTYLFVFTDLNVSLTDTIFGMELMSLVGIGDLSVTKTGDCANFEMRVTFSSLPGDLPEMTVSSCFLMESSIHSTQ